MRKQELAQELKTLSQINEENSAGKNYDTLDNQYGYD